MTSGQVAMRFKMLPYKAQFAANSETMNKNCYATTGMISLISAGHLIKSSLMTLIFLTAMGYFAPVHAEELPINDIPIAFSTTVPSNVFFEVDDSGSMDWEILTQKHWHLCAYDPNRGPSNGDCGMIVDNGLWMTYDNQAANSNDSEKNYIFDNDDNVFNSNCNNTLESCNGNFINTIAYQLDWRIFSSDFNTLAYDPNVDYSPWQGPCSNDDDASACGDASFSGAFSDPYVGSDGYENVPPRDFGLENFIFEVWEDDDGYSGDRPHRGADHNDTGIPNGEVDLWDTHKRYTVKANSVLIETITYNPDASGLNPAIISSVEKSGNECIDVSRPGVPEKCLTVADLQQNIANWYQYHRKRSYVAKNAIAAVVTDNPTFRYGLSVINRFNELFVQVPGANDSLSGHNQGMLDELFSLDWPREGTPLRKGLKLVGDYYDNAPNDDLPDDVADPITGSCQKNFAVLFTDGYWNGGPPEGISDEDNDQKSPTLADVAFSFYDTDLSPLDDEVPTDDFDNNNQQHMVTFSVAFGVEGYLADTDDPPNGKPDDAAGNDLLGNSIAWWETARDEWVPTPQNSVFDVTDYTNPAKIDDLWHAAFNSSGTYVAAKSPNDVVSALQSALQNIENRSSSAAAVALDSGAVGDNTSVYQASFDGIDWSGELKAIPLDPITGQPESSNIRWQASEKILASDWDSRNILTHTGAAVNNSGATFHWNNLSTPQQNALKQRLTGSDEEINEAAEDRLEYLRGNDAKEQPNGTLRNRQGNVLGPMINSAPAFMGAPPFAYPDSLENTGASTNYAAFRDTYVERTPMVYVGADDGILHGFNADSGDELLAYVPRAVFSNLHRLTDPNYGHRYFVDGSPSIGDAFIDRDNFNGSNKSWRTVLVGGLNKGGQGIYALDITDPDTFGATSTVLWDFTDADDTDNNGDGDVDDGLGGENSMRHALGDTFSQPAIVRLQNGRWAAIFGNGYNNTRDDGNQSSNGDAVLYILDLGTGQVIRKISTRTGSAEDRSAYLDSDGNTVFRHRANGLATPTPVDIEGDRIVDYVYAGDLFGNLWKFDLRSENPEDWDIGFHDNAGNPLPLFTACAGTSCINGIDDNHQPITTRPRVGRSPDRQGQMIYFGTGKYLSSSDVTDDSLQSIYGIIDSGQPVTDRESLLEQSILAEKTFGTESTSPEVRITSDHQLGSNSGWYLDFDSPNVEGTEGERLVQTPVLRSGHLIFNTLIPTSEVCGFGGSSWQMELNAHNGSRLTTSPFDLNNDSVFDAEDLVTYTDADGNSHTVAGSGIKKGTLLSGSKIVSMGDNTLNLSSDSEGNINATLGNTDAKTINRQSWRQLR